MFVKWFEVLFDVTVISPGGPNSQAENFWNWEFWEGLIPLYSHFVYVAVWFV